MSLLNKRIQFTVGVRNQTAGSEVNNLLTPASSRPFRDTSIWTPAYALVVKPVEDISLYANYIEGLQTPVVVSGNFSNVGTAKLKAEDLSISKILVDAAPTAKRVRFQSMGRVFRIRKRYCHVTIEVEGEPAKDEPKAARGRKPRARKAASKDAAADEKTEKKTAGKKTTKTRAKKAAAPKTAAKAKKAGAKDKKAKDASDGDKVKSAGKKAAENKNEGSAPETQEE